MPFVELDVDKYIKDALDADPELKKIWDETRSEYAILGQLIKLRKESGYSQSELARKSGSKQQVISRIESKESSPTLKTLCRILDALNYEIKIVPKQKSAV